MQDSPLFKSGLEMRKAVLGSEYVEKSLANADEFTMPFQEFTTTYCWGALWTRPYLDRRTRSLINVAMLSAMGKTNEVKLHVKGALNNGCTLEEIREALLHSAVYAGIPAALEGFKAAHEVLKEEGAL